MSGLFEHLAATDDTERIAARKAVVVAHRRVQDFLGDFVKLASDEAERAARLALVEDDVTRIVVDVTSEYGGDPEHTLAAVRAVLGCDESSESDSDDDDDDFDGDDAQSAFERNKFKKKDSRTVCASCGKTADLGPNEIPPPEGQMGIDDNAPSGPLGSCPHCGAPVNNSGQYEGQEMGNPYPFDEPSPGIELGGEAGPYQASVRAAGPLGKAARRPKMCPYHSELVDASLQSGSPQYAAYSGLVGSESHCKGGFSGTCNFKPEMVAQSYWDGKKQEYAERAQRREQERAQPAPVHSIPEPTEPDLPDEGDGITDLDSELADAPSAVGEGISENFADEPAMTMAASQKEAFGLGDFGEFGQGIGNAISQLPGDAAQGLAGGGTPTPSFLQGIHPMLQDLNQQLHQQHPAGGGGGAQPGGGPYQGAKPGVGPSVTPNPTPPMGMAQSLYSSEHTADAPRDGGGAVKTEELKPGNKDALGGPSPKIDKSTWKPHALNDSGNVKPIDSEQSGSPHPTETQDVTDEADHEKDFKEQTDAVTEEQSLPTADDSGASTERNVEQPHTNTFNDNGADPITRSNPEAILSRVAAGEFSVVPMTPEHAERLGVCDPSASGTEPYAVVDQKGVAHAAFDPQAEVGWGGDSPKPEYQNVIDRTKPHIFPEAAAQDPDKNPIRDVLESTFPTQDEVKTAIARYRQARQG